MVSITDNGALVVPYLTMAERAPAPGDLALVQRFLNTVDLEEERDEFGTTDGFSAWLREAKLLGEGGHYSPRNARYDWLTLVARRRWSV